MLKKLIKWYYRRKLDPEMRKLFYLLDEARLDPKKAPIVDAFWETLIKELETKENKSEKK